MTEEEMLEKQEELSKTYKYKALPPIISYLQRIEYEENLSDCWKDYAGGNIYSLDGILIASGLTERKYVCGDYGIFLEVDSRDIIKDNIIVKPGEEYRINDIQYSVHVKYHWYVPVTGYPTKIYYQQKTVTYADYLPEKWYFSPYEVKL